MTPLRGALFLLAAASTAYADHLKVVFSGGEFASISGPSGGNAGGNYQGFAIINDDNVAIYNDGSPADKNPCLYSTGGRTFTIEGDCWATARTFNCHGDFNGKPEKCSVMDADGNTIASADAKSNTDFAGIAIGEDSACVLEFDSDDVEGTACPEDDGNGPLHVTSG